MASVLIPNPSAGALAELGYAEVPGWLDGAIETVALSPSPSATGKLSVEVWEEALFDEHTVLQICSEHANGSRNIQDMTGRHSLSLGSGGGLVHSTAQAKHGASSIYHPGASQNTLQSDYTPDFAFGSGDFTIEWWLRPTSQNFYCGFGLGPGGAHTILCGWNGNLYVAKNGAVIWNVLSDAPIGAVLDVWNHLALVRNGTSLRLYLNGVSVPACEATLAAEDVLNDGALTSEGWQFGQWATSTAGAHHLEDVRITKGLARYTANFTPPGSFLADPVARHIRRTHLYEVGVSGSTVKVKAPEGSPFGTRNAIIRITG